MSDEAATSHECASCRQLVPDAARYQLEAHGPACQQPEIRFRRMEAQLQQLGGAFRELAEAHNEAIGEIQTLKGQAGDLQRQLERVVDLQTEVVRVQGRLIKLAGEQTL